VEDGLAVAAHRLDASYTVAYIAHAPLEPRAAVAQWAAGNSPCGPARSGHSPTAMSLRRFSICREQRARDCAGHRLGVRRKHTSDAAIEAARLARAAGRPVKVVWTREEDSTWAYFRPAGVIEIKSGISGDGR